MYKFESCGCLFRAENGTRYALDMTTPFKYANEEAASRDTTVYRFRKEDGRIKLIAYEKEWPMTETLSDGRRAVRYIPVGDPISRYTWIQFCDLGGRLYRISDEEDGKEEPTEETFDSLFPNLEPWIEVYVVRCAEGNIYPVAD